jgi:hypothetical protein
MSALMRVERGSGLANVIITQNKFLFRELRTFASPEGRLARIGANLRSNSVVARMICVVAKYMQLK